MSHAIWSISYQLVPGTQVEEFLQASKKCHDEVLSRQPGFISWDVLRDGDTWVDLVQWETDHDAKNAETAGGGHPAARDFYSHIDMSGCKLQLYHVARRHTKQI